MSPMYRCSRVPRSFIAATLLLAGCGGLLLPGGVRRESGDWPADGGGMHRTGAAGERLLPPLEAAWETDLASGSGRGSPLLADSFVFIGTLRGEVLAFHARTGARLGSISTGESITGAPVLGGDTLYVPLAGARESILAFDLRKGGTLWRASCGDIEASLLLAGGRLYAATTEGAMVCLDAATGAVRWTFTLPGNRSRKGIRSAPALNDSLLVFGADDGFVYALDPAAGTVRWRCDTGSPVMASAALVGGLAVTGNLAGDLVAITLDSGAVRWRHATGSPVRAGVAAADGIAVFGTIRGTAHAIDLGSGALLWERDLGGGVDAAGVISGGHWYVGTLRGRIMALRLADGNTAWTDSIGGRLKTPPAAAHGLLVVATDDRRMRGYRSTGR